MQRQRDITRLAILTLALAMGALSYAQGPAPSLVTFASPPPAPAANPMEARLERLESMWDLPLEERQRQIWPMVRAKATEHGLDACVIMAIIQTESCFRPWALSPKGAVGLMQITPLTAEHLGLEDPVELEDNLEAGILYFARLKARFDGDMRMALAAYNAGPTKVEELGQVPDITETTEYVSKVMAHVGQFRSRFRALASR